MIQATLTRQPDGSLLIEVPNVWEKKQAACRRGITANIRGRRLDVFVGMVDSKYNNIKVPLWYFNNYRDAQDYDEPVGQIVVASNPEACIKWLRAYTPRGQEQESLIEYFSWFHMPAWWKARQEQVDKEVVQWEEERRIEKVMWYAKEEERLNQEALSLTESQKIPVEIYDEEIF